MAYAFDWLLTLLESHALIDSSGRRDIEIRAGEQRLRFVRERFGADAVATLGHAAKRYQVSPAELVASFDLHSPAGAAITEELIAALVAQKAGLPYVKIDPLELDMGLVAQALPRPFALRHVVLPIAKEADGLTVAVEDPFDLELDENLRRLVSGNIKRVVASKRDIYKCITEIYGFRSSVESAAKERSVEGLPDLEQLVRLRTVGEIESTDKHVVNAVDLLLRYAFDQRASDIHIEPRRAESQVRLRIDGVLHDVHQFPRSVHPAIVSRIKTMARMDIAEKRRPQDGRIKTSLGDKFVELRVSTLPVAFGEKAVIRVFDPDVLELGLGDLGFEAAALGLFERWIGMPHGLILVTGPTGSGKTTTLYTALRTLARQEVNVTSVEDPIEMVTDRFNQVAVQPKAGVDFAKALRTILRQDPDIIMVGEIRDAATAEIAIQAALTGHLVLSTLHTNDTVGAITRLLDLGVPAFLLSSTLIGVMAQRLVRRICEQCRQRAPVSPQALVAMGLAAEEMPRFAAAARGAGCANCRSTGFRGRVAVLEMLDVSAELAVRIAQKASEDDIRQQALAQGLQPLRQAAVERWAQGSTTFDEVLRVVGYGNRQVS